MVSTITPFSAMSTQNELWFKEPVAIYHSDESESEGLLMCFIRNLEEHEDLDNLDLSKEFADLAEGTICASLYRVSNLPDGGVVYTEVVDYEDFDATAEVEFFIQPKDEKVEIYV
jgi:hypothetical protein